jgi:RNA polymerase sigma-70 factor (sigma-E family)
MRSGRDVAAFSEFVAARSNSLFRTAYLMVGDHQLAQDLVQEALVKTLIAWPKLKEPDRVEAYTRRIVVNTSISWRRRRSFHERPAETLPEQVGADPVDDLVTHDVMLTHLLALAPRQRAAVVLRYYVDLTEAQTADAMGCSVGTVKSQVASALKHLRVSLGRSFEETSVGEREATP